MRSIPPGETSVLQNNLLQVSEAPRYRRTVPLTEPEQLTQHKSKRLVEGFVSNGLLSDYCILS